MSSKQNGAPLPLSHRLLHLQPLPLPVQRLIPSLQTVSLQRGTHENARSAGLGRAGSSFAGRERLSQAEKFREGVFHEILPHLFIGLWLLRVGTP